MSVCTHDQTCPGYGWTHDAELTQEARRELGIPLGPVSFKKAKRAMRRHRHEIHEGALYAEIGALKAQVRVLSATVARMEKEAKRADVDQ